MKFKKLSVLFACLLFVSAFCMAGCGASSQAPEAFAVSIYKVEKEQDEDGKVYITNYDLWKSYNVTPTQAIDLPDYDPEKEEKDCKVSYKGNYNYGRDNISGEINGNFLKCKNKIQFIPYANSIIFARERRKKTINFFYEGKNITEYLDETQLENYNKKFVDTYQEDFNISDLSDFMESLFGNGWREKHIYFYTKENSKKPFLTYYGYNSYGSLTLIKSTDVYLKISTQ